MSGRRMFGTVAGTAGRFVAWWMTPGGYSCSSGPFASRSAARRYSETEYRRAWGLP